MPNLSWNEIRARATAFSREWKDESSEDAEAKSFWDAFFHIFGITRRRIASFETPIKKSDGRGGFIDLLWRGVLLVEHKSRGRDLDRAFHQAKDYFHGLKERDLPRYVLVSDFARFRLYDLDGDAPPLEFQLSELSKNIVSFGFIAGYQTRIFPQQDPVNIQAAEKLGTLHDLLKDDHYDGHPLEILLVRILFCFFAEDNAIFERQQFREFIEAKSNEDFTELGGNLAALFQVLNSPPERRNARLNESLAVFPYINGRLFEEAIPIAWFSREMCEVLLDCTTLDWSRISPAIFGALFQSIMDKKARRNLGAHYTSETNILKALQPLFLDSLRTEFESIRHDSKRLIAFHEQLGNVRILDPACGCGNFLVVAYRELRLLELDVLRALFKDNQEGRLDVSSIVFVDVDQFYGIEIEEFPAQIAQVALWMTDHQMNQLVSAEFGQYFARLPLKKAPHIIHGNALQLDWTDVIAQKDLTYIVGNPPFVGAMWMSIDQHQQLQKISPDLKGVGILDYVCGWYFKAAAFMHNTPIRAGFVSTNSITQGEQASILWNYLFANFGTKINFAYRTFVWDSEARGKAHVHVVIVGFSNGVTAEKRLYDEAPLDKTAPYRVVGNISPYLNEGPDFTISNRSTPLCDVPRMFWGSQPRDGGNFILNEEQYRELIEQEPLALKWIRPYMGGEEFINGSRRWCLWLVGMNPANLSDLPRVRERVDGVKKMRSASRAASTQRKASTSTLFAQIAQPDSDYLAIPEVSSERRSYIPMAFVSKDVICSNKIQFIPGATIYHFAVLTSAMHMAWIKRVAGRLKSDFSYSNSLVYNNFPWPHPTEKQRIKIENAAQEVLDERQRYTDCTLAVLYDDLLMPPDLVKAHRSLDRAVDAAYRKVSFQSETERVGFLFTLYEQLSAKLTAPLLPAPKPARRRRATT